MILNLQAMCMLCMLCDSYPTPSVATAYAHHVFPVRRMGIYRTGMFERGHCFAEYDTMYLPKESWGNDKHLVSQPRFANDGNLLYLGYHTCQPCDEIPLPSTNKKKL
ncbi:hypothetical protein F4813DRAFT_126379 [Daldinia decipiens]|uniref:uncharacterized protein n=1 Tax=Daldinia decipiens TaxID=326647 RepID=UPI0020C48608|nr:uncharacterized protein F4813DRAFT_126379 [Daldinia decipiens]KAI1656480.1 hypothetical protein F4813DRAFT_126379 [Daldinia decipiens]